LGVHGHRHHHGDGHSPSPVRRLAWVLAITILYAGAEFAGGIVSNSLALLADSGHMLTDALALALALAAAWFAKLPPDRARTYGYQRAEILAALANGVALVVICGFLFWEAWKRLFAPPEVKSGLMDLVAVGGLLVNLAGLVLLREVRHGLNARAAYLHVMGDLLGSVGTLVAAGLVAGFGFRWADPVAGIAIGATIIVGSARLVLQSLNVLMEGAPREMDLREVRDCLLSTPGVAGMHDLHVWTLSGGHPILTAHLVVGPGASSSQVLRSASRTLEERFGIRHSTLQIEPPDYNIFGHVGGERGGADVPPRAEHPVRIP
jgi:cobalt-zinc-cadmium efflux system protein